LFNLQIQPDMPFATQVSADKRLIDFLFGDDPGALDSNYTRFYRMLTNTKPLDPIMTNQKQLDSLNISYDSGVRLFNLFGDEGSGRKFFIQNFCKEREMNGIILDCHKLFAYDISFLERALWAVCRECILSNCSCTLDGMEFREDEKEHFYSNFDLTLGKLSGAGITVFCVSEMKLPLREMTKQAFTQLELDTPGNYERFEIWKYYAQGYCFEEDVDLEEMATKFLFTAGKVKGAITQSRALADMERLINISRYCIFEACYGQMKHELTQKATKVKVVYTLDDIVMNPTQRETIERVCEQMRYRKQVYEKWDYNRKYPYGRGLSVLLFGAPGTGKSMSAQVIASALNLELYRVDLSKVVDKYVGETEKSISMIFREAKKCNVVLFFDEADTMFGKRTDSGGSGESAANNKTAHLLQEVEAYDGVTVLATNYKHNIDPAFFRRMKFIVEYQFPDPDTREMLWRTTIPKGTPLADDVDIRFLAERFEFAGGNIKNCILNAAFFGAAEGDGSKVYMKNYLEAIRYEFIKTGKIFAKTDFEPYASLLGLD
ncbi:MAG: ATP-binding protein, partial [Eubacteriales bacterium]